MIEKKIRVLFVCMGNICRSPMAEGIFRDLVAKAGLSDRIEVDSAGTSAYHVGEEAHSGTLKMLKRNNIVYKGRGRKVEIADLQAFDYVLAMDNANLRYLKRGASSATAQIMLFLSFAKAQGSVTLDEVPDPFYDDNFDRAYHLISLGCQALLRHLRETEAL